MNKHLLQFLLLLFLSGCNSVQERVTEYGELQTHENFFGIRHGKGTIRYPSGNLHATGSWEWGKRNGEYKEYYDEGGGLYLEANYVDDLTQGNLYKYYPDGTLKELDIFQDDIVMYSRTYSEDGELNGVFFAIDVIKVNEHEICLELLNSIIPTDSISVQVNLGEVSKGKFYIGKGQFSKTIKGSTICIPRSELSNAEVLLCYFCELSNSSVEACSPFTYDIANNKKIYYQDYIKQESNKR